MIENKPDESICYAVDNHPQDSRISIREDGVVQTLPTNQTWGGLVLIEHPDRKGKNK